jgi:ATP-binding cassette subfamily G (WHITE) protein 2
MHVPYLTISDLVSISTGISSFPSERAISLRERAAGTYDVSAYFAAKTAVDIITCSWSPTVFSIIVYWTIGYQPLASKFFIYWIFMVLDAIAALSLATAVTCICVSIEMSTVVLSLLLEISRLYGGFFTSPLQLSESFTEWRFADALSYLKYTFVGVALNELEGLTLTCTEAQAAKGGTSCYTTGEAFAEARGYDEYSIGFCAGILVVYIVGMRIVAYLGLRYIKS